MPKRRPIDADLSAHRIQIRVTPEAHALADEAARAIGSTLSRFCSLALTARAKKSLAARDVPSISTPPPALHPPPKRKKGTP